MAKKKVKKTKEGVSDTFDRRSMEQTMRDLTRLMEQQNFASLEEANAFLANLTGKPLPSFAPQDLSPLEQAQELIYQAFEAHGAKRVKLAKEALKRSPDCADAYVLLAEEDAKSPLKAKALYEQGVKAAERALGTDIFREGVGHFWGILETRPYMRARAGLAECLWFLGERKEAIRHYQDMLRLNPGDNQGLRYGLINWLLEEKDYAAASKLLNGKAYRDDAMASWAYSRALLSFAENGPTAKSKQALAEALKTNAHVPAYLLSEKRMPNQLPMYLGFGDENEAVAYVAEAMMLWRQTDGALSWLAENRA
jgi:tetratricopeptide (TPR) repeat protein